MFKIHSVNFCIYYEDTDASSVAYHTSHLKFAERARTLLLKKNFKKIINKIKKNEFHFVVKEIKVDYEKPAFLFDELTVETFFNSSGRTYIWLKQVIKNKEEIICNIDVKLVWLSSESFRPSKLPNDLIPRFKFMEIV